MSTRWHGDNPSRYQPDKPYLIGDKGREYIVPVKQLKQQWSSPLTESRPPARPRTVNWELVLVVLAPLLVFWLTVVFLLWRVA